MPNRKRPYDEIEEERKVIATHVEKFGKMQRERLAKLTADADAIMEQIAAALRDDSESKD